LAVAAWHMVPPRLVAYVQRRCMPPASSPETAPWRLPYPDDTMLRRLLPAVAALALLALPIGKCPRAAAQHATTVAISSQSLAVDDLLRRGYELEVHRRWGEALTQYEEGLRQFPDETSLERRFERARVHYDLCRRFADHSFCNTLSRLPLERGADLYAQVLRNIERFYVDVPNWKGLFDRGTNDFDVALAEPAFIARHLTRVDAAAVEAFRQELRGTLKTRIIASREDARENAAMVAQLAQQRLGISATAVMLEYLSGATNSLDPYSSFLTPDQLNEVYGQIEGNFVGLGVELKALRAGLTIVRVITGSPAEQAGVRSGDLIIAIDGRSIQDLPTDQAANLLQGQEGTTVTLNLLTVGQSPRQVAVRRERVEVPSVDHVQIVDRPRGIGYLKLTCFQKTTRRDMESALWRLNREGMKSLVIDLRGNPGGLLVSAVEVANLFVDHGVIVSTRGRSPQEDFTYTAHEEGVWRTPLVAIVDQDSASAAEIFAGAMRDHHRGTLVGVRTFGKGSVQGIFPLESSDSGLRLTTAKFYSPNGHPYSRVGVQPEVLVHRTARALDGVAAARSTEDDTTLETAVQVVRDNLR
jgi:carboxyl-terminal processing protease